MWVKRIRKPLFRHKIERNRTAGLNDTLDMVSPCSRPVCPALLRRAGAAIGILLFGAISVLSQDRTGRDLAFERLPAPNEPVELPRGYALVIGVGEYPNLVASQQLRYSQSDAEAVYSVLIAKDGGNIPPENVKKLIGRQATLANIRQVIEEWLPEVAKEEDRVIVFFAGHGFVANSRGYLAPYDVQPANLLQTGYAMDKLGEVMSKRVRARWKVLLADACHSAKITAGVTNEALNGSFRQLPPNFLTLTAARQQERSYEDATLANGFGIFTYFLTRGWQGEADEGPQDGLITASELVEYARSEVRRYSQNLQTPDEHGDFNPNMILGYNQSRRAKVSKSVNEDSTVMVEVNQDGVEVWVGESRIGVADRDKPLRIPGLKAGLHKVKGVKMGYDPAEKEINVVPGQPQTVTLRVQYRSRKRAAQDWFDKGLARYSPPASYFGPISQPFNRTNLAEAKTSFTRALAEDDRFSAAALHLCLTYQVLGETGEALKACKKAIEIDPDYVEARVHASALLMESGDTDEAVRQLTEALRRDPKYSIGWSHLAHVYWLNDAFDKSEEAASKAISLDPKNAQAYLWRADSRRLSRNNREAQGDYHAYLKLADFESSAGRKLAFYIIGHGISKKRASQKYVYADQRYIGLVGACICEQQLGNLERARSNCIEALRYDANGLEAYQALGNVLLLLFNRDNRRRDLVAARAQYQRIMELAKGTSDAEDAVKQIRQIDEILPLAR
jgi:uncharacterized caspase-like protein/tetratricopeptide (TPR) repeat protein